MLDYWSRDGIVTLGSGDVVVVKVKMEIRNEMNLDKEERWYFNQRR
jgi:hypothetical protein